MAAFRFLGKVQCLIQPWITSGCASPLLELKYSKEADPRLWNWDGKVKLLLCSRLRFGQEEFQSGGTRGFGVQGSQGESGIADRSLIPPFPGAAAASPPAMAPGPSRAGRGINPKNPVRNTCLGRAKAEFALEGTQVRGRNKEIQGINF